jgi:PPP family 3-phenylpropionic acid transporter
MKGGPVTTTMQQAGGYAALCACTGAILPFIPVWFGQNGMNALQIGWILAIPLLGRVVTGPLIGLWADRFAHYRTPVAILAFIAALAYLGLALAAAPGPHRLAAFLVLYAIGGTAITNIPPLLDTMTLQLSRREGSNFGVARALGSGAFALTNIALGRLIPVAGNGAIIAWVIVSAAATWLCAQFVMPARLRHDLHEARKPTSIPGGKLGRLIAAPGYLTLLLVLGCLQAAHSYYYAFSTLIWERQGLSVVTCGLLWGVGVMAELVFLSVRNRLRLGAWTLLLAGAGAGVLRWTVMGVALPPIVLYPLQILHAFSFTAVYVAGLELILLIAPRGSERLGQMISSAYAGGALIGLATLLSAPIFNVWAERGYWAMALLSLAGGGGAIWLYARRTSAISAATEN